MNIIEQLKKEQPFYWENPHKKVWKEVQNTLEITPDIIDDAEKRLLRFAPYFTKIEASTIENNGLIESPLTHAKIAQEKKIMDGQQLWLKRDDLLPIAGSIKARGGIHEVLKIAEQLAIAQNLVDAKENYSQFTNERFTKVFSKYEIIVGSTGNLGLSIGIISAKLGFDVTVHMSRDAKKWKKDLLITKGANVVEHLGDYGKAVEQGRMEAQKNEHAFFIDDENSLALFSGYAVAARRLAKQFKKQGIEISKENQLAVYLPCGVGGGPGGVAYGLKTVFGDDVYCYFAEPVQSPCMLLGMETGKYHDISVQDIGLSNQTAADGLAVGRASKFVGQVMTSFLDGIFTVTDKELYNELAELYNTEQIKIEPSAIAGVVGPKRTNQKATIQLIWLTGGSLVPENEWQVFYEKGGC